MIRTLIIEDEEPAAIRLRKLLNEIHSEIEVLDCIDSVERAVQWFHAHQPPELLLLDIQLADGLSFDIFKKVKIDSYVIFTTAFDEYAIKAFELNSIDYLLKPIDKAKLALSIEKFKRLRIPTPTININDLVTAIESKKSNYKKRFLINMGSKIKSVETSEVAFFYVLEKNSFMGTFDGKNYPIDFSLDKLETLLDPELFFRINRQQIINYYTIDRISVFSKSRIRIEPKVKSEEELLVSANKSHEFRQWLDR
ncbi:MAG TPA: DNA-binding response regulator [Marinilabiliales bacterium]|nr:MAG: hypothetical protein A2W95_01580 [Bacteroidetes bacterium GWA2_40_14]OFX59296.1 MAG: hypothetical protein A2W84_02285 [Bacteroidetes bacterium GWC2_40_13]OFX74733.1 MAG: hypothetical protein A2W96_04515 [Bacteroidetes bacterium GWD2_40_43]OFX88441.1 MAG: hypothetical protein A2W97_09470 [Bacteroidetes bacterium GWE2_40_63]OFY22599.1 MAG: hypothetical protein A2W88_11215 [Bacteroidetes bacterium GWF2_40_13]OFZ29586.1 MAG: hypothetical protein A2437_08800 [Bacteroidetes bacterium RIFOXYC